MIIAGVVYSVLSMSSVRKEAAASSTRLDVPLRKSCLPAALRLGARATLQRELATRKVIAGQAGFGACRGLPQKPGQERHATGADRSRARTKYQRVDPVLVNDSLE